MCVYPISDARDVFSPLGSRFWMVLRAGEVALNPQSDHHVFAGRGISASNAGYSQGAAAARTRLDQRAISGVSTIVGAIQITQLGLKRTFTTRNAVMTAIIAPIMRVI